ncbi:MAG: hypothetical protein GY754_40395 [bacterium]|nr:hypothetical protein [bacterium]
MPKKAYIRKLLILLILCLSILSSRGKLFALSGKAKLAIGQTINGAYMGSAYLYGVAPKYDTGMVISGVGAGALSLYCTLNLADSSNMPSNRAAFINSVSLWSALEGYIITWVLGGSTRQSILASGLTDLLCTGVTAYMSSSYEISSGDTALINMTAFWGSIMILETAAFIKPNPTGLAKYVIFTALTGSLTGGYFLAKNYEFSTDRCVKMSLYGLLGTFSGAGVAWVMYFRSKRLYYLSMLLGTAGGLVLGYFLTDEAEQPNTMPFSKRNSIEQSPHLNFSIGQMSW